MGSVGRFRPGLGGRGTLGWMDGGTERAGGSKSLGGDDPRGGGEDGEVNLARRAGRIEGEARV